MSMGFWIDLRTMRSGVLGDVLFFLGGLLRMEFLRTKSHSIQDFRIILYP